MAVAKKVEFLGPNRDGEPRRFLVASGEIIPKGTLLKLSGTRLAAKQTGKGDYLAGVAAMEKSASDFSTSISAITQAVMTFTASGSISAGEPVQSSTEENLVEVATNSEIGSKTLGYAVSDLAANKVEVRINL